MELAREAGLEVRTARPSPDSELPAASGTCRVRGALWVILSSADSFEVQTAVLADALRTHAGEWLEGRYLPPAVRACVGGGAP